MIYNGKPKYVIDRTIPEIIGKSQAGSHKGIIRKKQLREFMGLIGKIGVDFMEINGHAMGYYDCFPRELRYIYRIQDKKDIDICAEAKFGYCIFDSKQFLINAVHITKKLKNVNKVLEIDVESIDKLERLADLKAMIDFRKLFAVRICGMSKVIGTDLQKTICKIKDMFGRELDICPENKYFMASAAGMESILYGADMVTVTFGGYGGKYGYAPLEEVIMALRVIAGLEGNGNMELLPRLKSLHEQMTGKETAGEKPVLGAEIFSYESGIHADGIQKDTSTYEPYEPKSVGLNRELVLGKHSGSRSVAFKLEQLNVHYCQDIEPILDKVREMSIRLKRRIYDEELLQICNTSNI